MNNKIENIEIGGGGVKNILGKYKPEEAIAEFIWNGFDAQAKEVCIDFEETGVFGNLIKIIISDNGYGIPQNNLNQKFKPFFESEKSKINIDSKHHSLMHGRNGVGRLTFFTFANKAKWTTRYKQGRDIFEYDIEISSNNLENYTGSNTSLRKVIKKNTGTVVVFDGIRIISKRYMLEKVVDYLRQEFGWFLELYKTKGISIKINGKRLDYENIIGERDIAKFIYKKNNVVFDVSFIRWKQSLQNEYSKFYLIDSENNENWKDTTKLNNKADNFFHSVFVKSVFFDDFFYDEKQAEGKKTLIGKSKNDEEYKFFESELTNYLRKKRKPFLKEFADKLVEQYEKDGIIPSFKTEWEQLRKTELEDVVKELYQVQPKIFSASSVEQKKTFVRFLNALLSSNEREQILKIISEVVDLDFDEREELLKMLHVTKLSNIIRTIKLITDRYKIVNNLKELVFNEELKANERDHIQKIVDEHFWLFGEQYHLIASTEEKFEKALRSYLHYLGRTKDDVIITHPDKNKEMDIFLCRQDKLSDRIENVVIELKSPTVNLGEKEVSQVKKYMNVVISQDQFNGNKTFWEFILVGNRFDTSGFIEGELRNSESHGEVRKGLIFKNDKYKIYVRKWSDIFSDFECRHNFLEKELSLERNKLAIKYSTAKDIIEASTNVITK
jgi:hypothetical protein